MHEFAYVITSLRSVLNFISIMAQTIKVQRIRLIILYYIVDRFCNYFPYNIPLAATTAVGITDTASPLRLTFIFVDFHILLVNIAFLGQICYTLAIYKW